MKITNIMGYEILDARGCPTIECHLVLEDEFVVSASVPAGTSVGLHEARELRDGGSRLFGKGVTKALHHIQQTIGPELIGKEPEIFEIDALLIELDGTTNKSRLGANTMLAVSMAVVRAEAYMHGLKLYELIGQLFGLEECSLPYPLFNMISGGIHADNALCVQEFLVAPLGEQNFRQALERAIVIFHELGALLHEKGYTTTVGIEGAYAPRLRDEREALDFLMVAIEKADGIDTTFIALDAAASEFYDKKSGLYCWHDSMVSASDMIERYDQLIDQYPIYSLEDCLAQDDWAGWIEATGTLADKVQLAGDDLFVSSVQRIAKGLEQEVANAVIIKPNQVGTVSETLAAIKVAQNAGMATIVSHRSGETDDTFIADLAVGTNAGQIKAGGCCRGERTAKYNRLLMIEDDNMF